MAMRLTHVYLLALLIFFAVYLEQFWLAALLAAAIVLGVLGLVGSRAGSLAGGIVKGAGEDFEREFAAFEGAHGPLPDPELVPDMLKAAGAKTAEYWWTTKQGSGTTPAQPFEGDTHRNTSKYLGSRLVTGSSRFLEWLVNRVFHMGHFHGHEGELHKGAAAEAAAKGGGGGGGGGGGDHGGGDAHGGGHGGGHH